MKKMRANHRFQAVMAGHPTDRVPLLDEGIRDDVIDAWKQQGLPAQSALRDLFRYDPLHVLEVDWAPQPGWQGAIETATDRAEWRKRLDHADPKRLASLSAAVHTAQQRQAEGHLIEFPVHEGLFLTLGIDAWASFESVLTLIAERPVWVRAIMDDQTAFVAALAEQVLQQVQVDFVSFSEPIASRHGPLIAPDTYRALALESYRPLLEVLSRSGVPTIVWTSYGNVRSLIPHVLEVGFDALWCYERESAQMDYSALRREYGHAFGLIGGIDLDAVLQGPTAIDAEFDNTVIPLLQKGGYIPLADGRVRSNMPFSHYAYYRQRLEEVADQTGNRSLSGG